MAVHPLTVYRKTVMADISGQSISFRGYGIVVLGDKPLLTGTWWLEARVVRKGSEKMAIFVAEGFPNNEAHECCDSVCTVTKRIAGAGVVRFGRGTGKTQSTYIAGGQEWKAGDKLRCVYDADAATFSYIVNGREVPTSLSNPGSVPVNGQLLYWCIYSTGSGNEFSNVKIGSNSTEIQDSSLLAAQAEVKELKAQAEVKVLKAAVAGAQAKIKDLEAELAQMKDAPDADTGVVNVRREKWYGHYRHTAFQVVDSTFMQGCTKVVLIGIKAPKEFERTNEEFPALMQDLRDTYTDKRAPFWLDGTEVQSFTSITEMRESLEDLPETLKFFSRGNRRAIVVSCPAPFFDAARKVILKHNQEAATLGVNQVQLAWATAGDVYGGLDSSALRLERAT